MTHPLDRIAIHAGLILGDEVGQYYWSDKAEAYVRRNADGADTVFDPLPDIATQLRRLLANATPNVGAQHDITGYTIQTVELHHIIELMMVAGWPILVPLPISPPEPTPHRWPKGATMRRRFKDGTK